MIKSIKMKNCATYDVDGIEINNCQKVNFFYGANGSGKSTVGNFLQNQKQDKYTNCEIEWTGDVPLDIVVYNREFRGKNFKENIAGVFTLGQATIEDVRALDSLKESRDFKYDELVKQKGTLEKKKKEKEKTQDNFKDEVWVKILKVHEEAFKEAFSGFRSSKDKFAEQLLIRYNDYKKIDLSKEELIKKAEIVYSIKPEKCDIFSFNIDDIVREIKMIEEDPIWIKIVVGDQDVPISRLIESLDNSDWVNQGRNFIGVNEICPFCQNKTITDDLQMQFKLFFCGEYEKNINYINAMTKKYEKLYVRLLEELNSILDKESSITVGKLNIESFKTHRDLLKSIFGTNIQEMITKEKEAARKVSLQYTDSSINELKRIICSTNNEITNHNRIVDNYNIEKEQLTDSVWAFVLAENEMMIKSYLDTIKNFSKATDGISKAIEKNVLQIKELDEKIIEGGSNITSIQPTVDEINRLLAAYGFTNFKIIASEEQANAYQICRGDGTLATNTLSEGEETFITFLYFMQLAKGATEISDIV